MSAHIHHTADDAAALLEGALGVLEDGFRHLPPAPSAAPGLDRAPEVLAEAARRMRDNYPYQHPLYAGQMLKPPHPAARAAYAMAMAINPNNHALDGGRASSAMEVEAVAEIAAMFGMPRHLGHLTSSGTLANLEALWIAGQLAPGQKILAQQNAHYTHSRISAVLGLPFAVMEADRRGRMDVAALEAALAQGDAGTVVVTLGTTGLGAVDPLDEVLRLRQRYSFRIHVDAAYGGYFKLISTLGGETARAFSVIDQADSIVVDPHKHGLQPYGCGCVLFRDPAVGRFYRHDSPYTYFTSSALHLGEISLECSRAGAAAVALWTTQRLLPLVPRGEFALGLEAGRSAALRLHQKIAAEPRLVAGPPPETDILVWAVRASSLAESSAAAQAVFAAAAARDLHLALVRMPAFLFPAETWSGAAPSEEVVCLRSVLMKPEHLTWADEIWRRLILAMDAVEGTPGQTGANAS